MPPSLSETVEQFLLRYTKKTTQGAYRNALSRYFAAGELTTLAQVKAVEKKDFPGIVQRLTCAPATVKHTIAAVHAFYLFLQVDDPSEGFRSTPIGDNVPAWNVLHEGDPQLVLEQISDPHDRAVFIALVLQGWRATELCNMKWKNVRQVKGGGSVVEWKGKRNKQRVQGLQTAVVVAIKALKGDVEPGSPLLPTPSGEAWTRHEVYGLVTRYAKLAGKHVTPHGLRATYISSVIRRKGIEAARQLAGHESLNTTLRYSRWAITTDDPLTVDDL